MGVGVGVGVGVGNRLVYIFSLISSLKISFILFLIQPDCSLKDLRLAGCHLTDNDILDMNR